MAEDREILREVWEGRIPVAFSLSPDEIVNEQPDPYYYYLLVPRLSYFPLVTDKVQKYFQKFLDTEKPGEFWLEFDGQPLKWHYPVGVLFDLYGSEESLPWKLTIHFQNFPEEELLHCPNKEVVESHFMSMVKEADALKHRSLVINGMQKKDHKQLWLGLLNDKFDQFWSVNRKLMESGEEKFKYIPYKAYMSDGSYSQQLFKPVDENGTVQVLADLIRQTLPDLDAEENRTLSGATTPSQSGPESNGNEEVLRILRTSPSDCLVSYPGHLLVGSYHSAKKQLVYSTGPGDWATYMLDKLKVRVITQGIEVPWETPILWLCEHLSYPDNFLHICVHQ